MREEHAPSWVAVAKSGLTSGACGGIADGDLSLRRLHGDNQESVVSDLQIAFPFDYVVQLR